MMKLYQVALETVKENTAGSKAVSDISEIACGAGFVRFMGSDPINFAKIKFGAKNGGIICNSIPVRIVRLFYRRGFIGAIRRLIKW